MAISIQVDYEGLRLLLRVCEKTATTYYKKLQVFCNKGDDYEPTWGDFARHKKWDLVEVLFFLHNSSKSIEKLYLEKQNTILLDGKYGKGILSIPEKEGEKTTVTSAPIAADAKPLPVKKATTTIKKKGKNKESGNMFD